jgi:DNA helicase HerA-like ATPase
LRDGKVFTEDPSGCPAHDEPARAYLRRDCTGKTKTLQMISEQLSEAGVPTLLMDIKGDLSGLATAGAPNAGITDRAAKIGADWSPSAYPGRVSDPFG